MAVKQVTKKQVQEFKREIIELCKKHGFSIEHEDHHGAFIIRDFNASAEEWFNQARYDKWS